MKLLKCKSIWFVLIFLVFAGQAMAQDKAFDPSVLGADGKKAYEELFRVGFFAVGGVGYSGTTSIGESSLDVLIGEDHAAGALKYLVSNANNEGALYALLGLKTLKCECFDTEVKNFKDRAANAAKQERMDLMFVRDTVNMMDGCLGSFAKKDEILEKILSGDYDNWTDSRKVNRGLKEKGE